MARPVTDEEIARATNEAPGILSAGVQAVDLIQGFLGGGQPEGDPHMSTLPQTLSAKSAFGLKPDQVTTVTEQTMRSRESAAERIMRERSERQQAIETEQDRQQEIKLQKLRHKNQMESTELTHQHGIERDERQTALGIHESQATGRTAVNYANVGLTEAQTHQAWTIADNLDAQIKAEIAQTHSRTGLINTQAHGVRLDNTFQNRVMGYQETRERINAQTAELEHDLRVQVAQFEQVVNGQLYDVTDPERIEAAVALQKNIEELQNQQARAQQMAAMLSYGTGEVSFFTHETALQAATTVLPDGTRKFDPEVYNKSLATMGGAADAKREASLGARLEVNQASAMADVAQYGADIAARAINGRVPEEAQKTQANMAVAAASNHRVMIEAEAATPHQLAASGWELREVEEVEDGQAYTWVDRYGLQWKTVHGEDGSVTAAYDDESLDMFVIKGGAR